MKPSATLVAGVLLTTLVACASTPRDRSRDYARALVGQWEYDYSKPNCPGSANTAYRVDGTLTATYGDCEIDSDGFGRFVYGWYIAREHVCFVDIEGEFNDERQRAAVYRARFKQRVAEGFVEDRCHWRVKGYTARTFTVVTPDGRETVLKRTRWL